jgi:hypothetical protein
MTSTPASSPYTGSAGSYLPDSSGNYEYGTAQQVANALKTYTQNLNRNLGY